ncbi:outer membrane lipoprotein-sorting protein [Phenylobacterium sp.]|uniref:outer membrane lipoprotein-sorting protein n=1 Tax=Phenylobacterium sp. TaxID=1871053 RepID=UPI0035ADB0E2
MRQERRPNRRGTAAWLAAALALAAAAPAFAADPAALMRAAFDNWRAKSSRTTVTMTIHRPSWERSLTMTGWTQGDDQALVRFTAPAKDAGNATLKLGDETWIYNPKLRQTIKLPASMLSQSWMGSDFSYDDLAKSDDLLTDYTYKITATALAGGHTTYDIEATPKPGAPIVWGKQVVRVRDDGIILKEVFFDQDMKPVRTMTTEKVGAIGGRDYPLVLVMRPEGEAGRWTRIETTAGEFNIRLPDHIFTRSNLENPRG